MEQAIAPMLEILHSYAYPHKAWTDVLSVCDDLEPTMPWHDLQKPNISHDVDAAKYWLNGQTKLLSEASGVYIGLSECDGYNVELGFCKQDERPNDKVEDDIEWVLDNLEEAYSNHLIQGLVDLKQVYSKQKWSPAFGLCDYVCQLAYSGIIFTEALGSVRTSKTMLAIWGFHDGDLFPLGKSERGSFVRIRPTV